MINRRGRQRESTRLGWSKEIQEQPACPEKPEKGLSKRGRSRSEVGQRHTGGEGRGKKCAICHSTGTEQDRRMGEAHSANEKNQGERGGMVAREEITIIEGGQEEGREGNVCRLACLRHPLPIRNDDEGKKEKFLMLYGQYGVRGWKPALIVA